jgi:hypothetical protein
MDVSEDQDLAKQSQRLRRRRWRLGISLILLVLVIAFVVEFRRPLFERNFGVVDANRVYRCEQPGEWLATDIDKYHYKSILNLRGGSFEDKFYETEVRITGEHGVAFYDFPLSASRRPTRRELLILLDFFERCTYPILIHCKRGSDRTGLVSALYLLAIKQVDPVKAEGQLCIEHGHVSIWGSTARLHAPLREYADWLRVLRLTHTLERFRNWVETEYQSDDADAPIQPLRPGPRKSLAGRIKTSERVPVLK